MPAYHIISDGHILWQPKMPFCTQFTSP